MSAATFAVSRESVLSRIQESPLRPTGLLTYFGADSYTEIQDALSDLLESGEVILTPDLLLKPAQLESSTENH